MKSSGGAAAGERSGSLRTTACRRLDLLAVPAGVTLASADGDALLEEVFQALLWPETLSGFA